MCVTVYISITYNYYVLAKMLIMNVIEMAIGITFTEGSNITT